MNAVQILGHSDYQAAHELQKVLVKARADGQIDDAILLLEHRPVITVGRRRDARSNVVFPGDIPVVEVERGGDVTWHGPGQLVAYPIILLEGSRKDLHRHLRALEDAVIALLAELGLASGRDDRNTGVWAGEPRRKVCSIGIACRRWVTWHGLALNVDPDPLAFTTINPCGFSSDIMSRVVDHCRCPPLEELAPRLATRLSVSLEIPQNDLFVVEQLSEVAGRLGLGG